MHDKKKVPFKLHDSQFSLISKFVDILCVSLINRCPTDAGAAIMVDPSGQTLTRITHPFTGGEVAAAVLPVYAFKFKSTGNVAFNCQVKICRDGEENNCAPVCSCLDHSSCVSIMFFSLLN